MKVQNYMTKDVFSIQADRKLVIADELMGWARIRHVPVVDGRNHLVGLLTHRDLLRASLETHTEQTTGIEQRQHLANIAVQDVMCKDVTSIDPEASVAAAARLMVRGKFGCLPVVDSHNELLGIITEADLLKILEHIDLETVPRR